MGLGVVLVGALLVVLLPLAYHRSALLLEQPPAALRNRRICLVIAHPDDEAMFFAPTVQALARRSAGNHIKVLCLSAGNAAGLGEIRKRELVESALLLGLRDADDVFVVDDGQAFPDSMTAAWAPDKIASLLASAFARPASPAVIDVLITFDAHGVSGHANHIALYYGATRFARHLAATAQSNCRVDVYTLSSVAIARKYASVVDGLVTLLPPLLRRHGSVATPSLSPQPYPQRLLFANSFTALPTAWRAMTQAHKSQMLWFRWLWILFSRYMLVNELRLEQLSEQGALDMQQDDASCLL
ncbi:hypothetical protein CDD81_1914 [Ophiocordyceps australis]|uniref:N-acetylglucosaminylphosphatidylinositol deacetylase n=1 Tax=Ophiocordyceps australis TaxID=1399860 RepID=A0A2C5XSL5_9HYPO|nr:hypothetical protein CDD81_1914 [Ophiocordyceps australis]